MCTRGSPEDPDRDRAVEAARLVGVGRLTPSVCHQLGTPLQAITLRAESLERIVQSLEDPALLAKARRSLEAILEEAFRCKELLGTLQLFAHAPRQEIDRVDLVDVCRGAARLVRHEAMRRQVEVTCRVDEPMVGVRGQEARLRQAVLALLLNAVAASPDGGVVTVETHSHGEGARVVVTDRGPGVEPSAAERLFEPFFSTRPAHAGVGLGLMACHAVATAHGGTVSWEAAPGEGTRFTLSLPGEDRSGV